jgi:RimJ/RimL family protein N-acetyltransferase
MAAPTGARPGILARLAVDRIETSLRDGTRVVLRPVRPNDKALLRAGFARLSEESRYRRFMSPVSELSDAQLAHLTELDFDRHVAWAAVLAEPGEDPAGIGIARYVRLPDEPDVAEAAITVLDEYQGRGLGTLLLGVLAATAFLAGVRAFRGYVLEENLAVRELIESLGARTEVDAPGTLRLDVPLDPASLPDSPAGRLLKAAAARLVPVRPTLPF